MGVLPVSHGGTGSTSPSGARLNLGAAAANHTHNYLPLSGGTLSGTLSIERTIDGDVHRSQFSSSGSTGSTYMSHKTNDVEDNYVSINANSSTFKIPLSVSGGGTGAASATEACTNLGAVTISTAQTISGEKILGGRITFQNHRYAPYFYFRPTTNIGGNSAYIFNNLGDDITTGTYNRLYIRLYSRTDGQVNGYYEDYRLPIVDASRTSNGTYDILTTKNKVSVSQGGTGTSTKGAQSGGALANIGCIYSSSEPSSPYIGMVWLKPVT